MRPVSIISVQPETLAELIKAALAEALAGEANRQAADSAGLSLNAASRLARRRREIVAAALESGALPGRRYGKAGPRQRWSILAGDVRDWLTAGCPTGGA